MVDDHIQTFLSKAKHLFMSVLSDSYKASSFYNLNNKKGKIVLMHAQNKSLFHFIYES